MSSLLVNINLISICLRLLKNLNTNSERDGDYIDNLRIKHVTATVFCFCFDVAGNVHIILLLNSQLNKSYNLMQLPECFDVRDQKIVI